MKLSDEAIQEFSQIFKQEFNEDLPFDRARELAESFMGVILLVLRPLPPKNEPTADKYIHRANVVNNNCRD